MKVMLTAEAGGGDNYSRANSLQVDEWWVSCRQFCPSFSRRSSSEMESGPEESCH